MDPYAGAPWLTTDGVEWERVQDPAFAGAIIEGIASSDQTTVALGWLPSVDAPEAYRVAMWTTEDGADWSRIDAVLPFGDVQQGMGIGIGGGGSALAVWVMANPAVTSQVWLSADGVRWDEGVELPIGTVMGVSSLGDGVIAYGTVQEAQPEWRSHAVRTRCSRGSVRPWDRPGPARVRQRPNRGRVGLRGRADNSTVYAPPLSLGLQRIGRDAPKSAALIH